MREECVSVGPRKKGSVTEEEWGHVCLARDVGGSMGHSGVNRDTLFLRCCHSIKVSLNCEPYSKGNFSSKMS